MNSVVASARPRITHAINSLGTGGAETICLEVLRYFQEWSDNELLILHPEDQPRRYAFDALGIRLVEFPHPPRGGRVAMVLGYRNYFRRNPCDGLLCWSFGNHAFQAIGARLAGVRHIVASVQNAPPNNRSAQRKWAFLARLGFLGGCQLVACSNHVRDRLVGEIGLPASKIHVILNGCNVEAVRLRAAASRLNKPSDLIIGMVARFDAIKDHDTLLRAFAIVLEKYPTAELWLVGEGPRRSTLEALAEKLGLTKQIRFLGFRNDIPGLLGQMDVFAFSTTSEEGLPVALVEALAAGVLTVATDVAPCREVLRKGKFGLLAKAGDALDLASKIVFLVENKIHTNNCQAILESFDTKSTAAKYRALICPERN